MLTFGSVLFCSVLSVILQVKRELSRSHWSKYAQSSLCSDYRLAKKQGHVSFVCFASFFVCLVLCLYERDHTNVKVSKGQ